MSPISRPPGTARARTRPLRSACAFAVVASTCLLAAAPAMAHWSRVALARTLASPYYVCPPGHGAPRCALIEDPTPAGNHRGPLPAGAITKGPVQEVSPALEGGGEDGGYDPEDLRAAYGMPSATAGGGETVALVDAESDNSAEADLAAYRSHYHLPPCTAAEGCFRKVNVRGVSGEYPTESSAEWAAETSMDLDMVSAICPGCKILLVEAKLEPAALAEAEDEAVALGATEVSNSFVTAQPSEPAYAADYDHPGVPIAAAGGDEGYGVVTPAANPHVIAVGGTSLRRPGSRWSETAWSGTGSGCSLEPKPEWQLDTGCAHRTTNDVAAVADPNTPVSVYDSFTGNPWKLEGGTSVATPIVAASMALTDSYTRSFEGAQALYIADQLRETGFNDIVAGSNGTCSPAYLCTAEQGYDGPTGLGSLHGPPTVPPPEATTEAATSLAASSATLNGTVAPNGGRISACEFEYSAGGQTGDVPCSSSPSGTAPVAVSAQLRGLAPSEQAGFRLIVTYSGGTAEGAPQMLTTLPVAPGVATPTVSAITAGSATLNTEVNPEGSEVGTCKFEYGTSTSYGSSVPCTSLAGAGRTPVSVAASLSGLTPLTTYHLRVVAANRSGQTSESSDATFTTASEPPTASTAPASSLTPSSATLGGVVDPMGGASSCGFELSGSSGLIPCSTSPGSGTSPLAMSASVNGLRPDTTYEYRIVASNSSGTTSGNVVTFATPPQPTTSARRSEARLTATVLYAGSHALLPLRLRCSAGSPSCKGTITLHTIGSVEIVGTGGTSSRRVLLLASARFTIAAGRAAGVQLRLSAAAQQLLAKRRTIRARASVVVHEANGTNLTVVATVTIKIAPAHGH